MMKINPINLILVILTLGLSTSCVQDNLEDAPIEQFVFRSPGSQSLPETSVPRAYFTGLSTSKAEGETINIPVSLSSVASSPIKLALNITEKNAELNKDYRVITSTITISAGNNSGNFRFQLLTDTEQEEGESFTLQLRLVQGEAVVENNIHTINILNEGSVADELTIFKETLYDNILRNANTGRCFNCHRANAPDQKVSPYHSQDDASAALQTIKSLNLVNLTNPGSSRLVSKIAEGHKTWSTSAKQDADSLREQIEIWANRLNPNNNGDSLEVPVDKIASEPLTVAEGRQIEGSPRYSASQIAFYDFKKAADEKTIYDQSGVSPALNLTISDDIEWLDGQGIKCNESGKKGKAEASVAASKKIHSRLVASDQYTIEMWVRSDSADQSGPATMMTYSNGTKERNFTMGQVNTRYTFLNRNPDTDENAKGEFKPKEEFVSSERPQNQHIVMMYDGYTRKIYINGALVDEKDPKASTSMKNLNSWNNEYKFAFCNETSSNRPFKGSIYMAAIHDKALTAAQVQQNFDAGFAKKVKLEFDISEHTNNGAKFTTEVEVQGKYLIFTKPSFTGLSKPIDVAGIKFALNNFEISAGQSFAIVEKENVGNNQVLSDVAAIIESEDFGTDKIRVFFSEIAGKSQLDEPLIFSYEGDSTTVSNATKEDANAIKLFIELYQTMANITGVPMDNVNTRALYEELKTALPTDKSIETFSSTQQVSIIQLSYEFCDEMVKDESLRTKFYGSLNINQSSSSLFTNTTRSQIANSIIDKAIGRDIETQPNSTSVSKYVNELITEMTAQGKNPEQILKGVCVLGIANMGTLIK